MQAGASLSDEALEALESAYGSFPTTCVTLFSAFLGSFDLTLFDPLPDK
jgi:hypothetical protein